MRQCEVIYINFADASLNSTGYESWTNNEPSATPAEDCGVFGNFSTIKYGLGDFSCSENLPYICEEGTVVERKSIPTPQDSLTEGDMFRQGYQLIPQLGYYKFHENLLPWQEAVDVCAREGAHLLIINSEQEAMAVKPLLLGNCCMWIGVHDQYQEGNYVTVLSEYFTVFLMRRLSCRNSFKVLCNIMFLKRNNTFSIKQ